jgi:hypothetical protein
MSLWIGLYTTRKYLVRGGWATEDWSTDLPLFGSCCALRAPPLSPPNTARCAAHSPLNCTPVSLSPLPHTFFPPSPLLLFLSLPLLDDHHLTPTRDSRPLNQHFRFIFNRSLVAVRPDLHPLYLANCHHLPRPRPVLPMIRIQTPMTRYTPQSQRDTL